MFSPVLIVTLISVGVLIGGVGIGGILLIPALKYLGGIPLHQAISACMLSYVFTGLIGVIIYAKHGTIQWSLAARICLGALPGAYLGAFLLPYFSAFALESGIGVLILMSGIHTLSQAARPQDHKPSDRSSELIIIGFVTGIGSALTGTGGPLLLIPLLIWRKNPVLTTIGLSQAIQIPISLMATLGNFIHADVDLRLGLSLALFLGTGAILGAKIAHRLPVTLLKNLVSGFLIIVGLIILSKLGSGA